MEDMPEELAEEYNVYRGECYAEIPLDDNTTLLKAVHRVRRNEHYLIHRQTVTRTAATSQRLSQLQTALQHHLLTAIHLLPVLTDSTLTIYLLEPVYSDRTPLSRMNRDSPREKLEELYAQLMLKLQELHTLHIPHLELTADSVLVEEKQTTVHLRPFHLQPPSTSDSCWYQAPEQIFTDSRISSLKSDIWSLGCLYSDFFLSLTPLFQSVESEDRFHRLFEMMGLPDFESVKSYISPEIYDNLRSIDFEVGFSRLISGLDTVERELILSMLSFNPGNRPSVEELMENWRPESKIRVVTGYRPVISPIASELAVGPYEFYERSGRSAFSSIDVSPIANRAPSRRQTSEIIGKSSGNKAVGTSLIEEIRETAVMDNVLTVKVKVVKNLSVFKYQESPSATVALMLEVDCGLPRPVREQTLPVLASDTLRFDYTAQFHINTAHFKSLYRHSPLSISLLTKSLSPKTTRTAQETVIGVCKVYLGLLFVQNKGEKLKVEGWFHVIAEGSGAILGQMQVEVELEKAIPKEKVEIKHQRWEAEEKVQTGSIATVCQSKCQAALDSLTSQLRQKALSQQHQPSPPPPDLLASLRSRLFPKS